MALIFLIIPDPRSNRKSRKHIYLELKALMVLLQGLHLFTYLIQIVNAPIGSGISSVYIRPSAISLEAYYFTTTDPRSSELYKSALHCEASLDLGSVLVHNTKTDYCRCDVLQPEVVPPNYTNRVLIYNIIRYIQHNA